MCGCVDQRVTIAMSQPSLAWFNRASAQLAATTAAHTLGGRAVAMEDGYGAMTAASERVARRKARAREELQELSASQLLYAAPRTSSPKPKAGKHDAQAVVSQQMAAQRLRAPDDWSPITEDDGEAWAEKADEWDRESWEEYAKACNQMARAPW